MRHLVYGCKFILPITLAYIALFTLMQMLENFGMLETPPVYGVRGRDLEKREETGDLEKREETGYLEKREEINLPVCAVPLFTAGIINVNKTEVEDIGSLNRFIKTFPGGRWHPSNCTSKHKVAILVPYRNRAHMLGTWLQHMHPFLQKQKLEYGIYIIEQDFAEEFNRGALLNIGAHFALNTAPYGCFIFHDIDYLPENLANYYGCPGNPTHFGTKVECKRWKKLWPHHFGGVSAIPVKDFLKVNGFSNGYFGWGSEDDDLSVRLYHEKLNTTQRDRKLGLYRCLSHEQAEPGTGRYRLYTRASIRYKKEGFNSVRYELIKYMEMPLYTRIFVHLDKAKMRQDISDIETKICETRNCTSGNIWTKHKKE